MARSKYLDNAPSFILNGTEKQRASWILHEKTRRGENICEKCGRAKIMYYTPRCFFCETPVAETREVWNYMEVKYWMKTNVSDFDEDKCWSQIVDHFTGNDTYCSLPEDEPESMMELIYEHFPSSKGALWFISW